MDGVQGAVRDYGNRALAVTLLGIGMVAALLVGEAWRTHHPVTVSPNVSGMSAAATVGARHAATVGHEAYPDCATGTRPCVSDTGLGFTLTDANGAVWAVTVGDDYTRDGAQYWLLITGDLSAAMIVADCADVASDEPCVSTDEDTVLRVHDHVRAPWDARILDSWSLDHGTWYVVACSQPCAEVQS